MTKPSAHEADPLLRARTPWLSLGVMALVLPTTLGGAAANMLPMQLPTRAERQRAEQAATADARRARIAALAGTTTGCDFVHARELARLLVLDGQSATELADDYTRRCGEDPIVERWSAASRYALAAVAKRAARAAP